MQHSNNIEQDQFLLSLAEQLKQDGYTVEVKTPYHFRINSVLDVYPVNRRFHDLAKNERGTYQDIFGFVGEFFWVNAERKRADKRVVAMLEAGTETYYIKKDVPSIHVEDPKAFQKMYEDLMKLQKELKTTRDLLLKVKNQRDLARATLERLQTILENDSSAA